MDMYHWNKQYQALSGYETIPTSKGAPLLRRVSKGYPLLGRVSKGPPFEISSRNRITMPFCRECGKEVQEDWITCPYCSQSIGPPATKTINQLNDSVVGGDVITNINNDSSTISTAVKSASKCRGCGSIGTTQIACSNCRKIAYCSVCEDEVYSLRIAEYSEHKHEQDIIPLPDQRLCQKCYSGSLEQRYRKCSNCSKYYENSYHCETRCPTCDPVSIFGNMFG